jgi:hypothetical protein
VESLRTHERKSLAKLNERLQVFAFLLRQCSVRVAIHEGLQTTIPSGREAKVRYGFYKFKRGFNDCRHKGSSGDHTN